MSYFDPKQEGTGDSQQSQGAPANAQPLGYQRQGVEMGGMMVMLEPLRRTRPWVRFISILIFIAAGLMITGGLCSLVSMAFPHTSPLAFAGFIYVPLGIIYLIPGIFLHRYANGITRVLHVQDSQSMEIALDAQRGFWKCVGVMTIILMSVYLVIIGIFILYTVMSRVPGHPGGLPMFR